MTDDSQKKKSENRASGFGPGARALVVSLLLAVLGAVVVIATAPSQAYSGGITGTAATGCNCHSGGTTPSVAINSVYNHFGCSTYPCMSTSDGADFMYFSQTGAQANTGGDAWTGNGSSYVGGTLSGYTASGTSYDTYASGSEVTHNGMISGNYFYFYWDPPTTPGYYAISAYVNSVNGNGTYTGDFYAHSGYQYVAVCKDDDNDGFIGYSASNPGVCPSYTDCNDSNSSINTSATEICDSVDNDCDGSIDEGCDDDNDNYCDSGMSIVGTPSTCTWGGGDCNDGNSAISPGATEACNNVNDDCDGSTDEGCDDDGDDYCDSGMTYSGSTTCPNGGSDCNDANAAIKPGATETCNNTDDNCSGAVDEGCDDDNDDYCDSAMTKVAGTITTCASSGTGTSGGDCNDTNAAIKPGATETCNNTDDNCSGAVDEGCDDDNDDYCDSSMTKVAGTVTTCVSSGTGTSGGDCNDGNASIKPGQAEACNNTDDNCSGAADEGCDDDGDDYCDSGMTYVASSTCPNGGSDCNDAVASIKPGGTETCNNADDNCSGAADEGCDDDGDDYCDSAMTFVASSTCPNGGSDCNDTSASIKPGIAETCNNTDDNCSGAVDEGCDDDNDNYCDASLVTTSATTCTSGGNDCNDTDAAVKPGATEVCDSADNNCVSGTDEGCDDDNDNYCDSGMTVVGTPATCTAGGGDCSDAVGNAAVNPGATEICNNVNDDCDASTDEGCDDDNDDYCDATMTKTAVVVSVCPSTGSAASGNDCNDASATSYPGATEICDGADNDCDATPDDNIAATTCGLGVCQVTSGSCVGGVPQGCTPNSGAATAESCSNQAVDNDCDGNASELANGIFAGDACVSGQAGQCSAGTYSCVGSILTCTPTNSPVAETCANTGTDDDCDNNANELENGKDSGAACSSTGLPGICSTGTYVCSGGTAVCQATFSPGAVPETCANTGTDNDCDSDATEIANGIHANDACTSSQLGECAPGKYQCVAGSLSCVPNASPVAESCDNKDNDCDGTNDDGVPLATCGVGECANTGTTCFAASCTPKASSTEICDNKDNDCDGATDEGCDDDGDDFCDSSMTYAGAATCPNGGGDCNDASSAVRPTATESCNNVDDNCSGAADEGCDDDGDGYCDASMTKAAGAVSACPNSGAAATGNDCNDSNAAVKPGVTEKCDNVDENCNGTLDEGCDDDNDDYCDANVAYTSSSVCPFGGEDCDDAAATTNPGASEICDGKDNDCDGPSDENIPILSCGIGECVDTATACVGGVGQACTPKAPTTEVCDGKDNDCDGTNDNGIPLATCGIGECFKTGATCNPQSCDPNLGSTPEICDDKDNNCNGTTDDGVPLSTCGQGICARTGSTCHPESCAPGQPSLEVCDGLDNDCNGTADDGLPLAKCGVGACATVGTSCMPSSCAPLGSGTESCDNLDNDCDGKIDEDCDDDGDDYCDAALTFTASDTCPKGGGDCDDELADTHPGAPELCDGADNDCNTTPDDNITEVLCGIGACKATGSACVGGVAQDCTPLEPALTDSCDAIDNDCDGRIDNGTDNAGIPDQVCGVGACQVKVLGCVSGEVPACAPLAASDEVCDGFDNDCNGDVDEGNLCDGGFCVSAKCLYPDYSGGGASGVPSGMGGKESSITNTAGAASFDAIGGAGGQNGNGDAAGAPSGCGCEQVGQAGSTREAAVLLLILGATILRRRRVA